MRVLSSFIYRISNVLKRPFNKGTYYRKSLIIVLLATFLPIAVIGGIAYVVSTSKVKEEVKRTHSIQLKQAYNDIDRQLAHLKSVGNEWAFNPLFLSDLKTIDLGVNFERTNGLVGALRVLINSSPFIYDVNLYVDNNFGDAVMSEMRGLRYAVNDEARVYRELLSNKNNSFWIDTTLLRREEALFSKTLVQRVPGNLGNPYGLLVFYLDKKTVDSVIGQLNFDREGAAFILDGGREWRTKGGVNSNRNGHLEELIRKELQKKNESSGSFTYKDEGISYLVTHTKLASNGWEFVVATPLYRLMAPVDIIARLMLIIFIVVLLVSIAISFLASSNIYKPFRKLLGLLLDDLTGENIEKSPDEIKLIEERWKSILSERKQLKSKLELNHDSLKEGFLLQLVQGQLCFLAVEELKEQFSQYWWEPDGNIFSVFIIRISGSFPQNSNFFKGDEGLVNFASVNVTEEILKEHDFKAAVANFHDLSLSVIIAFPSEENKQQIKARLLNLAQRLSEVLTNLLKIEVTIALSRQINSLTDISKVVEETRQALLLREINKKDQIIDMDTLIVQGDYKTNYPLVLEKNILDCMKMGMELESLIELEKFIKKLRTSSGSELVLKQGILQLLGSMMHMLNKTRINPNILSPGIDLYEELGRISEPAEILRWFKERMIVPYIHEVLNVREQMAEKSVKKVIGIIENEYKNQISLESCADIVGMTPYNLSREFKLYTEKNFIDYLTDVRLCKAKELLESSPYSVNEIAEKVGYQPTYFARIFKKVYEITPGQYRKQGIPGEKLKN